MENIAVIHWYWVVDPAKKLFQLYIWSLKKYLDSFHFDKIIVSWWFTSKDIKKSEAQSLKDALYDVKFWWQWILEEESFTTFENIKYIANIIDGFENKDITVFCWNTHLPKIVYLSLQYYLHIHKWEVLNLIYDKLKDINLLEFDWDVEMEIWGIKYVWLDLWAEKKKFWKAIWSSILESHYDDFPEMHQKFLEDRKKLWWIK